VTPTVPTSAFDQPDGSEVIVKEELLALCPFTVTEIGPEVAPVGTATTMLVLDQLATAALVPLSLTVLLP